MNNSIAVSYKDYCHSYNSLENITRSTCEVWVLNKPTCMGKTSTIVKYCLNSPNRIVYVTPSYEQLNRFLEEVRKTGTKKKVVILKGKNKVCRMELIIHCSQCKYRRKYRVKSQNKIFDESLYPQNVCPYYNLLREAKDADIILTTLPELCQLFSTDSLPYRPTDVELIVDEADAVVRMLYPQAIKLLEFNVLEVEDWVNLRESKLSAIDYVLKHVILPREWKEVFTTLINRFRMKTWLENLAEKMPKFFREFIKEPLINNIIEHKIKPLNDELNVITYKLEAPIVVEEEILYNKSLSENLKRLFIQLVWALFSFKEVKVNRKEKDPSTYEIWLVPFDVAHFNKLGFLFSHRKVIFISGSLSEDDFTRFRLVLGDETNLVLKPFPFRSEITHQHTLVLVTSKYNCYSLVSKLSKQGFITYVSHSSKEKAEEFAKKLAWSKHVDSVVPETIKELEEALVKGVRVVNLVQCSKLARNLRLPGDVAIVGPHYITKHVKYYGNPRLLHEIVVKTEVYQALSRILNAEKRPIVLVMPKEVYDVLKHKFGEMKCTVKHVDTEDAIIREVLNWIPKPLGLKYSRTKDKLKLKVKARKVVKRSKGREYVVARILIDLPADYIGKEFNISEA